MDDYMSCPKCGSPVIVKDFIRDEYECSNCGWDNYKNRLLNPEKPENRLRVLLSEDAILCQLAEECSELAQAALKLKRAKKPHINPTTKTEEEARENLL